ncbi:MAG: SMC-Scp complex subunit ScpB, partial [Paramuribaculum sp.]|nr:SMC-Scp complex subunit ScpB [Paramuribaculum sp.]
MENLESLIESVLYVAGEPVELSLLAEKFEVTDNAVKKALENLSKKYNEKSGIQIVKFKNKIQFSTNPQNAEAIEKVLNPIKEKVLSRATLETLAIIAYKQPITRLEIEEIRGVNSDYAIDLLSKNSLIEVVGRKDAIGKPLLFGTTDDF